ncbi:MAG: hypothetical protein RMM31_08515 [Anaerolineae bacterium]|nr:hypothetical protein [Anaerolineae bacterium]
MNDSSDSLSLTVLKPPTRGHKVGEATLFLNMALTARLSLRYRTSKSSTSAGVGANHASAFERAEIARGSGALLHATSAKAEAALRRI